MSTHTCSNTAYLSFSLTLALSKLIRRYQDKEKTLKTATEKLVEAQASNTALRSELLLQHEVQARHICPMCDDDPIFSPMLAKQLTLRSAQHSPQTTRRNRRSHQSSKGESGLHVLHLCCIIHVCWLRTFVHTHCCCS